MVVPKTTDELFDELEDLISRLQFLLHLKSSSEKVSAWPEWKRNIL